MNSFGSPWPSPGRMENISDDGMPMDSLSELHDGGLEPEQRPRCNTWPLPRPENFVDQQDGSGSTKASNQQLAANSAAPTSTPPSSTVTGSSKKNSSRRNAWGNLSYADLITQAISSAADSRLTLSQIYEWMVQNVPYFKDKGDSNSSAGWKNSIRHNLSLHNRFMRVQNEGTGKSSWWMLNPDAKPGKSVRRRAATMDTKQYEKRRGRAKKRVEAIRNAQALGLANTNNMNDATPSPSSSVSEGLDLFPDSPLHSGSFQLSPDFRQRASSNASSVGRLSPIPSLLGVDSDWPFGTNLEQGTGTVTATTQQEQAALDQLAGSIADELTLQSDFLQGFQVTGQMHNQPPPPYQPPQPYSLHATVAHSYNIQHMLQNSTREIQSMSPASGTEMSPSYPHSEPSSDYTMIVGTRSLQRPSSNSPPLTPQSQGVAIGDSNTAQTLMGQFMEALNGQTHLDDLNINLEPFQGGLDCNVDEVIKHELSVDGSLDFNFPMTQQQQQQLSQNCYNTTTTTNGSNNSSSSGGHNLGNNSNNNSNNNNNTSLNNSSTDTILSTLSGGGTQSSPAAASVVVVQHGQFTTRASVTPPSWVH